MAFAGPRLAPAPRSALLLATLAAGAASAQSVQLSRSRQLTVGDVGKHVESPDGQWVVYIGDQDKDGVSEIFSVRSDGSAPPVKLNDPLSAGGNVLAGTGACKITPGSDRVLYVANHPTTGVATLYSVPIAGGPPTQLSGAAAINAIELFEPFQISPDGARVVYASGYRLYGVDAGGGPSVQLSGPLRVAAGHGAYRYGTYAIAPDSSRVVYTGDDAALSQLVLSSSPIAGGTPVRLMPPGDSVAGPFALLPDGAQVLFVSSRGFTSQQYVYFAPLDGSRRAVRVAPAHALITSLQPDPTGARVVFTAYSSGGRLELYAARLEPKRLRGEPPRETRITPPAAFPRSAIDFRLSADGTRVVYRAEQEAAAKQELFSSPLDRSDPVRLSPLLPDAGDVALFRLSPDGTTVLYTADGAVDDAFHLFRVPTAGGASTQLTPPLAAGGSVSSFELCPSAARAVYLADQELDGVVELYSVPDAGGPATRLNPPLVPDLAVQSFQLDACGRAYYLADQDENEAQELFSVPVTGGGAVRLNTALPLAEVDDVSRFLVDAAGTDALYLADEDADNWPEVYSAPLDGSAPAVKVGMPPSFLGAVSAYSPMPDGTHLLVLSSRSSGTGFFLTPLDGSAPPLLIARPPPQHALNSPSLSPAGDRIVYLASSYGDRDLYSARTDGSLNPLRLDDGTEDPQRHWIVAGGTRVLYLSVYSGYRLRNIPIDGGARTEVASVPSGHYIEGTLLTPDLGRVVFRSDKNGDFHLYGAPVDGSAPAVRLSTGSRDVFSVFAFSVDGTRTVYAQPDSAGALQVFSVPVDGSASPTKLSGTLAVQENGYGEPVFQVSSSDRVVFARLGNRELYSAPIDGSAAPVLISAPMVVGGGLSTPFDLSPDGLRVAYVAAQDIAGVYELYGTPIDGSAAPVKLSPSPGTGHQVLTSQRTFDNGRVPGLRFSADGQRVAYRLLGSGGLVELFESPVDGSLPARRLHPAFVPGGLVSYFEVHGNRALFLADLDTDEVVELYASDL